MIRIIHQLFVLFFLLVQISVAQHSRPLNFFPLHIGDTWQYKIEHHGFEDSFISYQTIQVLGDTLFANGKTYFVVSGFGDLLFPAAHSFLRVDAAQLKVFHSCALLESFTEFCTNAEICFFNLGFPDSSFTYSFCADESACYAQYSTGFAQVGALSDSAHFKSYYFFPGGVGVEYRLSENLGISAWHIGEGNSTAQASLVYALVDGKEFGKYQTGILQAEQTSFNFALVQNYPNPFNGSTEIKYRLETPAKICLEVYNISGQLVKIPVNEFQNPGNYKIIFSAEDLPSGVYFYRLRNEHLSSEFKKMLHIK